MAEDASPGMFEWSLDSIPMLLHLSPCHASLAFLSLFFLNDSATPEIYTTYDPLSLHDALPIYPRPRPANASGAGPRASAGYARRRDGRGYRRCARGGPGAAAGQPDWCR